MNLLRLKLEDTAQTIETTGNKTLKTNHFVCEKIIYFHLPKTHKNFLKI